MLGNSIKEKIMFSSLILSIATLIILSFLIIYFIKYNIEPYINFLQFEILKKGTVAIENIIFGIISELKTLSFLDDFREGKIIKDGIKIDFLGGNFYLVNKTFEVINKNLNPLYEILFYTDENGNFITTTGAMGNEKEREFFTEIIINNKEYFVSDPIISKSTGKEVFVISHRVVNNDNKTNGIISVNVTLEKLTEIIEGLRVGKTAYGWAIGSDGTIFAHKNKDFIMKMKIDELEKLKYKGVKKIYEKLNKDNCGLIKIIRPDGIKEILIYNKIRYTKGWIVGIAIEERELFFPILNLIKAIIITLIIVFILVSLISNIVSNLITSNIIKIDNFFIELSSGEGDLTHKIEIKTKDEIGVLATNFNLFIDRLRLIVSNLKDSIKNLKIIGEILSTNMMTTTTSVNELTLNTNNIKHLATNQKEFFIKSSESIMSMLNDIEKLNELIESQSGFLYESSGYVEKIVKNIEKSGAIFETNYNSIKKLLQLYKKNYEKVVELRNLIQKNPDFFQELDKIIVNFNEITKKLNFNDLEKLEINNFIDKNETNRKIKNKNEILRNYFNEIYENLSVNKNGIFNIIESIKIYLDEVYLKVKDNEIFYEGVLDLTRIISYEEDIVENSIFEQNKNLQEISNSIALMKDITNKIKISSNSILQLGHLIKEDIEKMNNLTEEINMSIVEMDDAFSSINNSLLNIEKISIDNKKNIERVEFDIKKFKT
ncbi:MAG: cache domain-containing protein [Spirochaetes bacterium]|nr:cache domain-containing protein [Spirochaetota bacterium]